MKKDNVVKFKPKAYVSRKPIDGDDGGGSDVFVQVNVIGLDDAITETAQELERTRTAFGRVLWFLGGLLFGWFLFK